MTASEHPLRDRLLDLASPIVRRLGRLWPGHRSARALMAQASRQARTDDWGDESFLEPLEVLLDALRADRRLRLGAWADIHATLLRLLTNRLLIRRRQLERPDSLRAPLPSPVFVVGLPRTGTTLLQRLLAADPANRALRYWESLYPAPLPEEPPGDPSARIAAARVVCQARIRGPGDQAIHAVDAEAPEECYHLLMNSFVSEGFLLMAPLPRYMRWLVTRDRSDSYIYYRRQLQLLQLDRPACQWILKAPVHLAAPEALLAAFPDARLVQTHRDPAQAIPSLCSLMQAAWKKSRGRLRPASMGPGAADIWADRLDRFDALRDASPTHTFVDVSYERLRREPIPAVADLYRALALPFTRQAEQAMQLWLAENPQNKHGRHDYSLEQFGLSRSFVHDRFARYLQRHPLPTGA